jgi:hypothetical protein
MEIYTATTGNATRFMFSLSFWQVLMVATFSAVDGDTTPTNSIMCHTSATANFTGAAKSSARLAPSKARNTPANNNLKTKEICSFVDCTIYNRIDEIMKCLLVLGTQFRICSLIDNGCRPTVMREIDSESFNYVFEMCLTTHRN